MLSKSKTPLQRPAKPNAQTLLLSIPGPTATAVTMLRARTQTSAESHYCGCYILGDTARLVLRAPEDDTDRTHMLLLEWPAAMEI